MRTLERASTPVRCKVTERTVGDRSEGNARRAVEPGQVSLPP